MNFIYPLAKYLKITQGFKSSHTGLDFGWSSTVAGGNNQGILAIEAGTVLTAVDGYGNTYPSNRIYGNYVIVSHGEGWYSLYGHLKKGLAVKKGQKVAKGQTVGYMGNTGYSMGQHLHFELRKGGNSKAYAVDPMGYLFIEDASLVVNSATKNRDRIRYRQTTVGTPVARNPLVDQIEVIISNLNGRKDGSLQGQRLGYVTPGLYNIHESKQSGEHTFVRIETDLWCAIGNEWTKFHAKELPQLYAVNFPVVSNGDKNKLTALGDELQLQYTVTDNK